MRNEQLASRGRQLQYFYYDYNGTNSNRWIYWAVPLIAVGVFCFFVAIIIWMRRRRLARLQTIPLQQYNQQPPYQQPVTGYPTPVPAYSTPQYNSEYSNFNSVPQGGESGPSYPTPFPTQQPKPSSSVEMGYPQR